MWVKICGVRDVATAEQIVRLRPDAIGLNFYEKSARYVPPDIAARIADICDPEITRVGVFVNHSADEIGRIIAECHLDAVQLHGDEKSELLNELFRRLPTTPVYRAWRMSDQSLNGLADLLSRLPSGTSNLAGCLIDAPARTPGEYGGTGRTVSWDAVHREYRRENWPRLILAGGLTPQNVSDAIRAVQPWGVDVASGVESSPAVKDLKKVRAFIENARQTTVG